MTNTPNRPEHTIDRTLEVSLHDLILALRDEIRGLRSDLAALLDDPILDDVTERILEVVREETPAIPDTASSAVEAHLCTFVEVKGWGIDALEGKPLETVCGREAVVFPPALCELHGGLEVRP